MKGLVVAACLLISLPARAADIVLVLDDALQRDMIAVLNAARMSPSTQGLDSVAAVGRVWDKLKAAPVLKPDTPPPAAATPEKPQ